MTENEKLRFVPVIEVEDLKVIQDLKKAINDHPRARLRFDYIGNHRVWVGPLSVFRDIQTGGGPYE